MVDFRQHNGPQLSLLFVYKLIWASKSSISITLKEARGNGNSPINHVSLGTQYKLFPLDLYNLKKIHQCIFMLFQSIGAVVDISGDSDSAVMEESEIIAAFTL